MGKKKARPVHVRIGYPSTNMKIHNAVQRVIRLIHREKAKHHRKHGRGISRGKRSSIFDPSTWS